MFIFLINKEGHGKKGALVAAIKGTKADHAIFRTKSYNKEQAATKLEEWYQKVADCNLREVKSARDAIKSKEEEVLNYFNERPTNASAESFNLKVKKFRSMLHGVSDLPFFLYRLTKIFG